MEKVENKANMELTTKITNYRELFKHCNEGVGQTRRGKGKRVLVKADPGNGKTTFVRKVAWDWANRVSS